MHSPEALEQLLATATEKRKLSLGLPAATSDLDRRFALTPEGAGMLVARGLDVRIEAGAGAGIHYPDERYVASGARIVSRAETLSCDIVLHLPPMSAHDARLMHKSALLLTLANISKQDAAAVRLLLERHITTLALDLIADRDGNIPFSDILNEIDGRAAIAIASSLLADARNGKGILLGGIAGINPCEVTIIGAGFAGLAAARSAIGLGAVVRMFDSDVYRLREASRLLGQGIMGSVMHPKVLVSALRTADIVVAASPLTPDYVIEDDIIDVMKAGVITFVLGNPRRNPFPTMRHVDLAAAHPADNPADGTRRVCYVNAGGAVPRTTAMALSNTLATLFGVLMSSGGSFVNALKMNRGMQRAVTTFGGRVVNEQLGNRLGVRHVDIALLLQFS